MLMVITVLFFRIICINIKFSSQRGNWLLFLTTDVAAMTSHANQKYQGWSRSYMVSIISDYYFCTLPFTCDVYSPETSFR